MSGRRAKEIRRLAHPRPTSNAIANIVVEAGNAVILIRGANADNTARALEKRPRAVRKLVKEIKKERAARRGLRS